MSNVNTPTNPSSLHVPQSSYSSVAGMKSIMDAYNSQSKIQLYDDNSAMNCDDISGVKGKDIPLTALRPRSVQTDESGKPVYSKSQYAEDLQKRQDIRKAYQKMQGLSDEEVDMYGVEGDNETAVRYPRKRLENIEEAEIEYIEDVPDTDEGLLNYLETCISNAEANLEMLKSLYAALSPAPVS